MNQTQLLDEMARLLDSKPYRGRWPDTKKAFAKFTDEYHKDRVPWWKRIFMKIKGI